MALNAKAIAEAAANRGLDLAGTATAEPLDHLRERLEKRRLEGRTTAFEEPDINRRLDPGLIWPEARSIVVIGDSYPVPAAEETISHREPLGKVARCAQGFDYHRRLEKKAGLLVRDLQKIISAPLNYRILIDRNPLLERELAAMAGLGLIGENCNLITPTRGSFVALGTILIDRSVEPSTPIGVDGCLGCGRCREACPTGALIAPHVIDPARCLSYRTQLPGIIPEPLRPLMGNLLYGCDRCQEVCPYNQDTAVVSPPEERLAFFPAEPRLIPMLSMTKKIFSSTIALSAAGWRGKTTLQRNAVIALGNLKYPEAIAPLARLLADDPRPVIRLHAAWSLGAIGGTKARFYLEKHHKVDPHPLVREEARFSLERAF